MSRSSFFTAVLGVALAAILAGCASTTEITRSVPEGKPTKVIHTLFVAGVTTDDEKRRRYEEIFVAELKKAGVRGIPSTTAIPSTQNLTLPEMREKMHAASIDADAVLHVQLIDFTLAPALSPQDMPGDLPAANKPLQGQVNGIGLTLNAPPEGQHMTQPEVELQATLYELPQRVLLWTVTTRTHEAARLEDVARSHAKALIAAMRERGYIEH